MRLGKVDNERMLGDLEKVVDQVKKATEIISHLRTFGRAAPVTVEPVSVNDVIERALSLTQEQLRLREIEIDLDLCAEAPVVLGNSIQLEQVFINLLTNARDALEDAHERRIDIDCSVEGGAVVTVLRDTGPGIPEGLEQRIFDPFFTTKDVGTGTGLGLSITYGIIKDHRGSISVESTPGEGASFRIELPLAAMDANGDS